MILNMTGGGGESVLFDVVNGTEQPTLTDPAIWVNTTASVTGDAYVSTSAPATANAGDVWLIVSTASKASIPVTDYISVLPAGVKRYNGSTWDPVQAQYWDGSSWSIPYNLITTLFYQGLYAPQIDDTGDKWQKDSSGAAYSVTESSNGISAQVSSSSGVRFVKGVSIHPIYIDGTVTKVKFSVLCDSRSSRTGNTAGLGLHATNNITAKSSLAAEGHIDTYDASSGSTYTKTITVSSLSEGYYYLYTFMDITNSGASAKITIKKIWTE